jgi:hypothetical protein
MLVFIKRIPSSSIQVFGDFPIRWDNQGMGIISI